MAIYKIRTLKWVTLSCGKADAAFLRVTWGRNLSWLYASGFLSLPRVEFVFIAGQDFAEVDFKADLEAELDKRAAAAGRV